MDDNSTQATSQLDESNPFTSVPIEISVCVGKARPLVRELVKFQDNDIIRLDKSVEDPVELYAGDKLIALGQLEEQEGEHEGQLSVRITQIFDLQTRS